MTTIITSSCIVPVNAVGCQELQLPIPLQISALLCALSSLSLWIVGCKITARPGPNGPEIIVEPAGGGKPKKLPPQRIHTTEINGQCYFQFEGKNGEWYCFPCDLVGDGYAEPCSSLVVPEDAPTFFDFLDELLTQEGVEAESGAILEHFGMDEWSEGEVCSVPMALSYLDTDLGTVQVVVIARSDWEWPDNTAADVELVLFADESGDIADPTDTVPDAMAYRVTGTWEEVANSIASMFDSGFTWSTAFGTATYDIESEQIDDDTYYVTVTSGSAVLWSNM